jgi:DNA replication protein DnaC
MAARRHLPDIMGEALGRLRLANAEAPSNVVPLAISLAEPAPAGQVRQDIEDKLARLRLPGMAQALREQGQDPPGGLAGFEQRLGHLLDQELEERRRRRVARALKKAQLRYEVRLEEVDCAAPRGLDCQRLEDLAQGQWLREGRNLLVSGPVGSGKTFVACALARELCLKGFSVLYRRLGQLAAEMEQAAAEGRLPRLLAALARLDLLLLDDWGLQSLDKAQALEVFELLEARYQRRSLMVVSSLPPLPRESWPAATSDAVLAEAMADRLRHGSLAISLSGRSRRESGEGRGSGWPVPVTIS